MEKYNLLKDYQLVSDGSSVTSGNGLQSDHFDTTVGEYSVTIASLIGANVTAVFRGNVNLELVTSSPGNAQYTFNSATGVFVVSSDIPFLSGEKLFIIWSSSGVQTSTEPLTVQEVKDYLRLEGFIDDSESLSSDFDDDDTLISELITSARLGLEEFTGLSFIPKTWKIEFTNLAGDFKIPFGPVTEITSLTDSDDDLTAITEYTTTIDLKKLKTPLQADMIMTYEAGYSVLPKKLKEAMLKEVAYRYTHRGDELDDKGVCLAALNLASSFKEVDSWLA